MSENIGRLLEKLPRGSIAHELVSRLREVTRDQWLGALKNLFESRVAQKLEELTHAQGQASGD